MDEKIAIERLVKRVQEYASGREASIARGAETPHIAALLLQKYGNGIIDGVTVVFNSPRAADPISQVLDEEMSKIDPQWREHAKERLAGRPADLVAN